MKELSQVLSKATSCIEWRYFHLAVDGGPQIYRERVYCYELYHQMRSLWPDHCPYYLNGEVDKRAHPILTKLGVGGIPDLLVHQPGDMAGNYAIIEVKNALVGTSGIRNDLQNSLDLLVRGGTGGRFTSFTEPRAMIGWLTP